MKNINGEQFSFKEIKDFDEHIGLSIPNYLHIHELVESIGSYFITDDCVVYDLGCSTGLLLSKLAEKNKDKDTFFVGYDNSPNLFKKKTPPSCVLQDKDITKDLKLGNAGLVLSLFTLQFLSIKDRRGVIENVYKSLKVGGAFILTEKIYLKSGFMQEMFTFSHYDSKKGSFTPEEILGKQRKLREIMKPVTEEQNLDMLRDAGFMEVGPFFQSLNFKGWLCVK